MKNSLRKLKGYSQKSRPKKTLTQAYMRWKTRESFAEISGKPIFTMTKYEKNKSHDHALWQKCFAFSQYAK